MKTDFHQTFSVSNSPLPPSPTGFGGGGCHRRWRVRASLGMTMLELMIGMAISVVLFLALTYLFQISQQTFMQISNTSDFNSNGFQMLNYLRVNILKAGSGIIHPPLIAPQRPLNASSSNCGCGSGIPKGFTYAMIPGWTYIGYYMDYSTRVLPNSVGSLGFTPATCASQTSATFPDSNYFGVQCIQQCFASAAGFDKNALVNDPLGLNATACGTTPVHNCGGCMRNDIYQRLIPHVKVTTNSQYPTKGDLLTITFAVRSGDNNATDCLGNPISALGDPTTTVPILVSNSFRVSNNNTLQCQNSLQIGGSWGVTPGSNDGWTDIIPNVEYLRVMVGVNDNLGYTTSPWGDGSTANRYILPTGSSPSPLDVNRIVSVRLGLIVSSSSNILKTPSTQAITVFPSTNITYPAQNDLLQRKLFTTTIFLAGYTAPVYPSQCVFGSSYYYVKMGGIPWVNGALSSDRCIASGSCYTYGSFDSCEQSRYGVINANFGAATPH